MISKFVFVMLITVAHGSVFSADKITIYEKFDNVEMCQKKADAWNLLNDFENEHADCYKWEKMSK